jgi:polyferredoxin
MSIFSIAYFGFFREGCVCSVGSLQNVTLALFQPGYAIPISALLFFIIPLFYTLFFGRTFCAGVCPLGAIQDIVILKPIEIKPWLQKTLGIIPFVYLGLAVLYAATASDFIVCRYDPFIGIYRLDGTFTMFLIGGIFLLVGVFIARPYCRFFCPYGVLLNWVSRFSKKHITITPASCIQCKLCENS